MGPTALRYIRLLIVRHLSDLYAEQPSQARINSVCFSPNSDYLATAGQDKQVKVSCRFFVMLSQLGMTYMPTFVTLQLLLQQLTYHTHYD